MKELETLQSLVASLRKKNSLLDGPSFSDSSNMTFFVGDIDFFNPATLYQIQQQVIQVLGPDVQCSFLVAADGILG